MKEIHNNTLTYGVADYMEKSLGKIEGRVDSIEHLLENLEEAINGNGKQGLKETVVRLEEGIKNLEKQAESRDKKLDTIINSVGELKGLVTSVDDRVTRHTQDNNMHTVQGLLRSAPSKYFFWFAVISVIGHVFLETIIPADISLWSLIAKLLGL